MSPTSFPTDGSLPPLLALPTELKLRIILYLPHEKSPNLACLRRTHTSFRDIIPKSDIRSHLSPSLLCSQLLDTELNHPYLLPLHHFPCYRCIAVLPFQAFHPWMLQCNVAIGGAYAYNRFCRSCGFTNSTPEEENWKIEGMRQVLSQPHLVRCEHFNPLCLPHSGEAIPRCLYEDYRLDNLIAAFESKIGAPFDCANAMDLSDTLTISEWLDAWHFSRGFIPSFQGSMRWLDAGHFFRGFIVSHQSSTQGLGGAMRIVRYGSQ